jgi:hypothetical protein
VVAALAAFPFVRKSTTLCTCCVNDYFCSLKKEYGIFESKRKEKRMLCGGVGGWLLKNPKLSKSVFRTKILFSLALEIQFFNTLLTRFDINMLFKRENFRIK